MEFSQIQASGNSKGFPTCVLSLRENQDHFVLKDSFPIAWNIHLWPLVIISVYLSATFDSISPLVNKLQSNGTFLLKSHTWPLWHKGTHRSPKFHEYVIWFFFKVELKHLSKLAKRNIYRESNPLYSNFFPVIMLPRWIQRANIPSEGSNSTTSEVLRTGGLKSPISASLIKSAYLQRIIHACLCKFCNAYESFCSEDSQLRGWTEWLAS